MCILNGPHLLRKGKTRAARYPYRVSRSSTTNMNLLKIKGTTVSALLALALGLIGSAQFVYSSPVLGTMSGSAGTSGSIPETTLSALFAVGPTAANCYYIGNCPQIAFLQGIDSSFAGTSLIINSANPAFPGIVSELTNGVVNAILVGVVPGPAYGASSPFGSGYPETIFGTSSDLAGQTITSLLLRIDSVSIRLNPFDIAATDFFVSSSTAYTVGYTITVYGDSATSVPEPSSWPILLLCTCALIVSRRRCSLKLANTLRPLLH
jgi:hypothetical protein